MTSAMSSATEASAIEAPLEDLMVAMDVVDTVRHRQIIVDRELNADTRRERLLQRLREIYAAQGIEVTEAALESGVAALEEERFRYEPNTTGFGVWLAKIYVRRDRWLRPFLLLASLLFVVWFGWYFTLAIPEQRLRDALPGKISATHAAILGQADGEVEPRLADEYLNKARSAMAAENYAQAERLHAEMLDLKKRLEGTYEVRIISRPNTASGVWRVPEVNSNARNYYLIVEAVTPSGQTVAVPIRSEEDGDTRTVFTWGVRVSESTFEAVAADKRDDGIIQGDVIGMKAAGRIEPDYLIDTSGATITEW